MTTTSTPLVSLQAPKDVSIEDIEAELRQIWQSYNLGDEGMVATKATTFSFLVYEPDGTQQLMGALGFYTGPVDGISGPRTDAAIKAAQKAYGMQITGKSTPELLSRLQAEFTKAKQKGTESNGNTSAIYSPDLEGAGIADAIAAANPCRIITLCPTTGEDEGVTAQVSAYCPINKRTKDTLICCEYITLRGTSSALERIGGLVAELMISGLPKFVWWKATPDPNYGLFKLLAAKSDTIVVDSSTFHEPETDLRCIGELLGSGVPLVDLNWARLAAWQELTAEAFDPPERRAAIKEIDRITLDYEKGNPTQALMYLGWMANRLQWRVVSSEKEGGDYDIQRIKFVTDAQRQIEAELAGIPIADVGDVSGDLISLRLSSTNVQADCGMVLCSETTGCMRMEAGGGAQSHRIQQVTPLFDQNTEKLIAQQLRRWGRDNLYEESMTVTSAILKLANA